MTPPFCTMRRYGKDLMTSLEAQKPALQAQARQAERERRAARQQRCGACSAVEAEAGCPASPGGP